MDTTTSGRNSGNDGSGLLGGVHVSSIGTDVRYQGGNLPKGWATEGTVIGIKGLNPDTRTADIQFKSDPDHVRQDIPVRELILLASGNHTEQDDCR